MSTTRRPDLATRKDSLREAIILCDLQDGSDPELCQGRHAAHWDRAAQAVARARTHGELDAVAWEFDLPDPHAIPTPAPTPHDRAGVSAPAPADTYSEIVVRLDDVRHTITVIYRDGHGKRAADPAVLGPYPADAWPQIRTETRRAMRDLAAEHAATYTEEVTT